MNRQKPAHKCQYDSKGGRRAGCVESELEEAGEKAEWSGDEGREVGVLGEKWKAGVRVTLRPKEGRRDVGVDEEGDEGGDGEQNGRENEVGEGEGLDWWRTRPRGSSWRWHFDKLEFCNAFAARSLNIDGRENPLR